MAEVTRATVLAEALLEAVVDYYDGQGVDLPARRFLAPGVPSWDCEQVAVWIERVYEHAGDVNLETVTVNPVHPALMLQAAEMRVLVVRCTPAVNDRGAPPSTEMSTEAALTIYADQMLVRDAIITAQRAGDLAGCSGLTVFEWTAQPDQGGLGGGVTGVRVSLV